MARRYLKTVPHVRYTAVGINPALRASVADGVGKDILTKSLLCSGPWGDYEGVSPVLEALFAYDLGGKKISLSVGLDSTGQGGREERRSYFSRQYPPRYSIRKRFGEHRHGNRCEMAR